jgi:hypothetical protein
LTAGLRKKSQSPDDSVTAADDTDEEDELMNEDKDDHGLPVGKPMGRKKFLTITTGIIVFGFAIAMVIDELETGWFAVPLNRIVNWSLFRLGPHSSEFCRIDRFNNHLLHPARNVLLFALSTRTGYHQMDGSNSVDIWHRSNGILVRLHDRLREFL